MFSTARDTENPTALRVNGLFTNQLLKTTPGTDPVFKNGDIVYERVNPSRKLIVGQFRDGLYYCRLPENQTRHFVFQERELKAPDMEKGDKRLIL